MDHAPAVLAPQSPVLREQAQSIYGQALPQLLFQAMEVHRAHHHPLEVQICTLSNIKSGGCPEDCGYCPQSARHQGSQRRAERLRTIEEVLEEAKAACASGSTRFCMGAAWRNPRDNEEFERVLEMIRQVRALGLETCVTLGMLTRSQARRLKEAGLHTYNHNLDTSPEYYAQVTTTHSFTDRLETLRIVREEGIEICCGGILGLGESREDRVALLCELANLNPYPESVPINALIPMEGTPMENQPPVDVFELVRTIATARILMPKARVRLAAGRTNMSAEAQALCFLAGCNSIFSGEKLLTAPNPGKSFDEELLERVGMRKLQQQG